MLRMNKEVRESQNENSEEQVYVRKEPAPRENRQFKSFALEWLSNAKSDLKESAYVRYDDLLNKHIVPRIGSYPVSEINTKILKDYMNELLERGRLDGTGGLSAKMTALILTIVKAILQYAKGEGIMIICNFERLYVKVEDKEVRILNEWEQDALTKFLLHDIDCTALGVLLSMYTGIRIGELAALTWNDINISAQKLTIRHTMQRVKVISPNKSEHKTRIIITSAKSKDSIREIPLPEPLIPLLEKMQATPSSYLLTGDERRFVEPRTIQNRFKALLKKLELDDINFHALRHNFATKCVELGFDIKTLSQILGHSSVNITLQRYVHPSFERKRTQMAKLDKLLTT